MQAAFGSDVVIGDSFNDDAFLRVVQDEAFRNSLVSALQRLREEAFKHPAQTQRHRCGLGAALTMISQTCSHPHIMFLFFVMLDGRKHRNTAPQQKSAKQRKHIYTFIRG